MKYQIDKLNKTIKINPKFLKIKSLKTRAGVLEIITIDDDLAKDPNFINDVGELGVKVKKPLNFEQKII